MGWNGMQRLPGTFPCNSRRKNKLTLRVQNMFFLYGAQGPTAFSNGPTCVEVQGDWIIDAIAKCEKDGVIVNVTKESEEDWRKLVTELSDKTLFPQTDSW